MKNCFNLWCYLIIILSLNYAMIGADGNTSKILQDRSVQVFDLEQNTVSSFQFYTTNNGNFGENVAKNIGGGYWPRGSQNQYLFGSGIWFGAMKQNPDGSGLRKYLEYSYNPNDSKSMFVPGFVEDGNKLDNTKILKNRVYFSTDFNQTTGQPLNPSAGPAWARWNTNSNAEGRLGSNATTMETDPTKRDINHYPLGPSFISDEDIISVYKDTDPQFWDDSLNDLQKRGYPLGLQVTQTIYSWGSGARKDFIIQLFEIKNTSKDTLFNCWFGGVYDPDLAIAINAQMGATNDRARFFIDVINENLGIIWTNGSFGEAGNGFGYIGFSLIESPAIGKNGFQQDPSSFYPQSNQLGLKTFRNWDITQDRVMDSSLYNFLSSGLKDGDNGPGDKRIVMGTGPFNFKPGETSRFAFTVAFASPANGGEADGSAADVGLTGSKIIDGSLLSNVILARKMYYNQPLSVDGFADGKPFDIYPNPASEFIKIDYYLTASGNVKITLLNQLGQECGAYDLGIRDAGAHSEHLSLNNSLMDGVYFLRLQLGNDIRTEKISIVK